MTDDMIAFRELLEKGSDATLLREMIGFGAQRLMERETETLCGAGQASAANTGPTCAMATAIATGRRGLHVELRIPKPRAAISRIFLSRAGWRRRR